MKRSWPACPQCGSTRGCRAISTEERKGYVYRRRQCRDCKHRFSTYERLIVTTQQPVQRTADLQMAAVANA